MAYMQGSESGIDRRVPRTDVPRLVSILRSCTSTLSGGFLLEPTTQTTDQIRTLLLDGVGSNVSVLLVEGFGTDDNRACGCSIIKTTFLRVLSETKDVTCKASYIECQLHLTFAVHIAQLVLWNE